MRILIAQLSIPVPFAGPKEKPWPVAAKPGLDRQHYSEERFALYDILDVLSETRKLTATLAGVRKFR